MARRKSLSATATAEAIELLCQRQLHQCFWMPANEALGHGRLRVTYATTSNFDDESLPAVLFFHPMFGGRYTAIACERLAKEAGIRIFAPDRPGMGGSTPVPLTIRMQTWLETVPQLCKHLHIEHFHLVAHSAGTTYLLNTLYDQRNGLLDGKPTYVGLMAPWVHNEHSQVAMLNLASKLPNGMLDSWNGLVKFINQHVAPSLSWSGGAISSVADVFLSGSGDENTPPESLAKLLGVSNEVAREADRLQGKFYFAEDTTAGNEDAKLCLKMGGAKLWGACEDYPQYFEELATLEQDRKDTDKAGLAIRAFYAESDMMIGKGGQKYFDECLRRDGVRGPIDYEPTEIPGTNHETVFVDGDKSALPFMFKDIANMPR